MKKCYVGKPIEFTATYDWALYHAKSMLHFTWVGVPSVDIGSGFTVEPKIMNIDPYTGAKIPVYKVATLPCDLHMVVSGPGLPATGKEVALNWAQGPCMTAVGKQYCRQFLGVATLTAFDSGITYVMSFVSGYTSQEFGKDTGNVATWTICVEGPYSYAVVADLTKYSWRDLKVLTTYVWALQLLEAAAERPAELADLSLRASIQEIDETIRDMEAARPPAEVAAPLREAVDALGEIRGVLTEGEQLLRQAAETEDDDQRRDLVGQVQERLAAASSAGDRLVTAYRAYEEGLCRGPRGSAT